MALSCLGDIINKVNIMVYNFIIVYFDCTQSPRAHFPRAHSPREHFPRAHSPRAHFQRPRSILAKNRFSAQDSQSLVILV